MTFQSYKSIDVGVFWQQSMMGTLIVPADDWADSGFGVANNFFYIGLCPGEKWGVHTPVNYPSPPGASPLRILGLSFGQSRLGVRCREKHRHANKSTLGGSFSTQMVWGTRPSNFQNAILTPKPPLYPRTVHLIGLIWILYYYVDGSVCMHASRFFVIQTKIMTLI